MTIYSLIREQIDTKPDNTAVVYGERKISYAQLNLKINKLTSYLIFSGIKKGDIVGVSLNRSAEMVIALLSIVKIGAIYLPLDPSFPINRLKYMLDDSGCNFILSEESLTVLFNGYHGNILKIENYACHQPEIEQIAVENNNVAYILYTSGSTGNPKGVQITHKSLTNFIISMQSVPGMNSDDSLLAVTTLSFDISGLEMYLPLAAGGKLVISSKDETRDGKLLLEKLKDVSIMQATPSTWKLLLESGWNEKLNIKALCGGEPLSRELANKILDRVNELWNMYGPTETTIWSSCSKVEKDGIIHLGKPIRNTQFYVVDSNNQFCALGVPGELLIGGDGLSIGYLNRSDLTSEKFIDNPFDKGKKTKVYRTGDLVKINNQYQIEFLGRIDEQVKIRGFRIELGEIENEIRKNKYINDCAVVVKDFAAEKKLVAFYTSNVSDEIIQDASNESVESWESKWNYLYESAIEKAKQNTITNDYNLDHAVTDQLTQNQTLLNESFNEWLEQTVDRIKSLNPSRLLEIGCGGGQLLKLIADKCEYFAATDISGSSINFLESQLNKNKEKYPSYKLLQLPADADLPFEKFSFDTIVINSVTQYFPDIHYLLKVINKSLEYLADDGTIYIGDVQSFQLLRNYHLNDQLTHVSDNETVGDFLRLLDKRVTMEEELVVDPDFFYSLKSVNPRINSIKILLRRGHTLNETTQYHYDVLISLKKSAISTVKVENITWGIEIFNIDDIRKKLLSKSSDVVCITGLPNKRLAKNIEFEKLIEQSSSKNRIKEIMKLSVVKNDYIDPEELWDLGKEFSLNTELFFEPNQDQTKFSAVFALQDSSHVYYIQNNNLIFNLLKNYSNKPSLSVSHQKVTEHLRNYLNEKLPDYMIPSFFVRLESLPLTPNNKINKTFLKDYQINDFVTSNRRVKPGSETEKQLLKIWENLLGISEIGITDNFFELGGHSILAAQMFTDFEKVSGKRIPMATLFISQTILELAKTIDSNEAIGLWTPLIQIKKGTTNKKIYLIHGAEGNVLLYRELAKYLDPDYSVFGLQARGLNGVVYISETIEEMAADYIEAIKKDQPVGPYNLGGYCMGGTIAYEAAQQLTINRERVNNLFLIETYNSCFSCGSGQKENKSSAMMENIRFHFDNVKKLRGSDKVKFISQKALVFKRRTFVKINSVTNVLGFKMNNNPETFSLTFKVRDINDKAQMNYVPEPYPGKTILLRPKVSYNSEPDPNFGWKELLNGEFKVYNLDLAPRGMLVEPFVKETAAIITKELSD